MVEMNVYPLLVGKLVISDLVSSSINAVNNSSHIVGCWKEWKAHK
jgi:hypothetical protein